MKTIRILLISKQIKFQSSYLNPLNIIELSVTNTITQNIEFYLALSNENYETCY